MTKPLALTPRLRFVQPAYYHHNIVKRYLQPALASIVLSLALLFGASVSSVSLATELPPEVLSYLRKKDPAVKVRFDGLVLFSNGESYVPVLPETGGEESQKISETVTSDPEIATFPDFIGFDNNLYLIRLIQTASGRLTFPKREAYPIALKEGLLPQDFVLPTNLFIPVELKVILGALPYNPVYEVSKNKALYPASVTLRAETNPKKNSEIQPTIKMAYSFDLSQQHLVGFDPKSGQRLQHIDLGCSPASIQLSSSGKYLFIPCLSNDELVVVETASQLVKTRIPTGKRPDKTLLITGLSKAESTEHLLISNRYSPFITLVDGDALVSPRQISVPSSVGEMALIPPTEASSVPQVIASDPFGEDLFLVNLQTGLVERTLKGISSTSALNVIVTPTGKLEIWVTSRTENVVKIIDFQTGNTVKSIPVGEKPLAMSYYGGKMFILCAGSNTVDVIQATSKTAEKQIMLEDGSFPSAMSVTGSYAYIMLAASSHMVTVDLHTESIVDTVPLDFRSNMLGLQPVIKPPSKVKVSGSDTQAQAKK